MANDEEEDLRTRLRVHDHMYATLQQQGKPFEALEHLEKGLFVRKELYGPDHPEVGRVCQVLLSPFISWLTYHFSLSNRFQRFILPAAIPWP